MDGIESFVRLSRSTFKSLTAIVVATLIGSVPLAFEYAWSMRHISRSVAFGTSGLDLGLSAYGSQVAIAGFYFLLVGIPVQFLMQRLKLNGLIAFVVAGAIAGGLLMAGVIHVSVNFDAEFEEERAVINYWDMLPALGMGCGLGALYTLIAWFVRRPDRDAPIMPPVAAAS